MEFNVLVEKRRSCRVFKDEPVTREQVEAIVTAGQWAPSPPEPAALSIYSGDRSSS